MNVPEMAALFLGYRYCPKGSRNNVPLIVEPLPPGLKHDGPRLIDCSTFVTAGAAMLTPDARWREDSYARMQVQDPLALWSAPTAWAEAGVGTWLKDNAFADQWGVYQAWVDDKNTSEDGDGIEGGHQFFYHGCLGIRIHSSSRGNVGPTREYITQEALLRKYPAGIRGVAL